MDGPAKETEVVYAAIGRLVVYWNALEARLAGILMLLFGADDGAAILISKLGIVAVCNALDEAADLNAPVPTKEPIKYTTKLFKILREYRNYYVERVSAVVPSKDGENVALIDSTNGMGKQSPDTVKLAEIEALTANVKDLARYVGAIQFHLPRERLSLEYRLLEKFKPPSLLKKPPLPDTLKRRGDPQAT